MSTDRCGQCGDEIEPGSDARPPVWCPHCGAALGSAANPGKPAVRPYAGAEAPQGRAGPEPRTGHIRMSYEADLPPDDPADSPEQRRMRVYYHTACGRSTAVSGDAYIILEQRSEKRLTVTVQEG